MNLLLLKYYQKKCYFYNTSIPRALHNYDPRPVVEHYKQERIRQLQTYSNIPRDVILYCILPYLSIMLGPDCDLPGIDLSHRRLTDLDLVGANLEGANLEYSVIDSCDLNYANLRGSNLFNTIINGDLTTHIKTDFTNSNIHYINRYDSNLRGYIFYGSIGIPEWFRTKIRCPVFGSNYRYSTPITSILYPTPVLNYYPPVLKYTL